MNARALLTQQPDPQTLRELAAVNRAIANAAWAAYYGHARDMNPAESELQLAAANAAQKLAHLLEQRAATLEALRNVSDVRQR